MQLGTATREYWVGGSLSEGYWVGGGFSEDTLILLVGGPLGESPSLALLNRPISRASYGFL